MSRWYNPPEALELMGLAGLAKLKSYGLGLGLGAGPSVKSLASCPI